MSADQKHPLAHIDREIIKNIIVEGPNDYNFAELARLRIRYRNFPGAKDIQSDLDDILQKWKLTEEELFTETRRIHTEGSVYRKKQGEDQEDWS